MYNMAKNDNLTDFLTDVADAIRAKKGITDKINPQDFSSEIASIQGGEHSAIQWTGHADVEGLKAIGWDDDDIAYFQKHGVDWNEEDDEIYKLNDTDKSMYGAINASNLSNYKGRYVRYMPKFSIAGRTSLSFSGFSKLIGLPILDTSAFTTMESMFSGCYSLKVLPPLKFDNATSLKSMCDECYCLRHLYDIYAPKATTLNGAFMRCYSLAEGGKIDAPLATDVGALYNNCHALRVVKPILTPNASSYSAIFNYSYAINRVEEIDFSKITTMPSSFIDYAYGLEFVGVKNLACNFSFSSTFHSNISKACVIYMINNEAATAPITIKLGVLAYNAIKNDAEVLEALARHPNVSLASA